MITLEVQARMRRAARHAKRQAAAYPKHVEPCAHLNAYECGFEPFAARVHLYCPSCGARGQTTPQRIALSRGPLSTVWEDA